MVLVFWLLSGCGVDTQGHFEVFSKTNSDICLVRLKITKEKALINIK